MSETLMNNTVVIVGGPTLTDVCSPCMQFCPHCLDYRKTRVETSLGMFWWLLCIFGFFFFLPLCFCLCCTSTKDIKHFCPDCGTLMAVRKGGC